MQVRLSLYPGGKRKALTMSYDDGQIHDRRLVAIFNRHGIKGTFHLNSGFLGRKDVLHADEVGSLFAGHEVSAHSVGHPFLSRVPREELAEQILADRRALEALTGGPVRGMSYPFGDYNDAVLSALPALGIEYSRTTLSHGRFSVPDNFLLWHPTCHHEDRLMERLKQFQSAAGWGQMPLFYVWGHSYEFDRNGNWELIEGFCAAAAHDPDVWYATNVEIMDYLTAQRSLKFSVDRTKVYNPSAISVWIEADGQPVAIQPGESKAL